MVEEHIAPGSPAPAPGTYEELNIFGVPTGRRVTVRDDEELPRSARGFRWRRVGDHAA